MKRRGFLGGILASPLALKAAAEEKIAKLSGWRDGDLLSPVGTDLVDTLADNAPGGIGFGGESWMARAVKEAKLLRTLAPELFERKRRREAKEVRSIDPDLAALQSMSLAAKIAFQRERLYHRTLEEEAGWIDRVKEEAIRRSLG
jgi:hypothetical protein